MNEPAFAWTEPRVEQLKMLWADSFPASTIAEWIGTTRNAVLGKVHRLGMSRPRPPAKPKPPKVSRPRRSSPPGPVMFKVPAPSIAPPADAEPAGAHRCDLMGLGNESCRWVVSGEGEPFMFCGEREADFPAVPYCRFHARMAYRRPGEREAA